MKSLQLLAFSLAGLAALTGFAADSAPASPSHADEDAIRADLRAVHGDDTAIAWGTSVERFSLTSGLDFELHGRWNATLVRKDGRWRLASLSMNQLFFDNPLLNGARRMSRWMALAGLGCGLLAGILDNPVLVTMVTRSHGR